MGFDMVKRAKNREELRREFLKEIKRRYPVRKFPRSADVAGGHGNLAKWLVKAGYKVTIIDPKGYRVDGARLWKRKFFVQDHVFFDLIVGFAPCGASQKIVRAGKYKAAVLAPCGCRSVWSGKRDVRIEARAFMDKQRVQYKFDGAWFYMEGRRT